MEVDEVRLKGHNQILGDHVQDVELGLQECGFCCGDLESALVGPESNLGQLHRVYQDDHDVHGGGYHDAEVGVPQVDHHDVRCRHVDEAEVDLQVEEGENLEFWRRAAGVMVFDSHPDEKWMPV